MRGKQGEKGRGGPSGSSLFTGEQRQVDGDPTSPDKAASRAGLEPPAQSQGCPRTPHPTARREPVLRAPLDRRPGRPRSPHTRHGWAGQRGASPTALRRARPRCSAPGASESLSSHRPPPLRLPGIHLLSPPGLRALTHPL